MFSTKANLSRYGFTIRLSVIFLSWCAVIMASDHIGAVFVRAALELAALTALLSSFAIFLMQRLNDLEKPRIEWMLVFIPLYNLLFLGRLMTTPGKDAVIS